MKARIEDITNIHYICIRVQLKYILIILVELFVLPSCIHTIYNESRFNYSICTYNLPLHLFLIVWSLWNCNPS